MLSRKIPVNVMFLFDHDDLKASRLHMEKMVLTLSCHAGLKTNGTPRYVHIFIESLCSDKGAFHLKSSNHRACISDSAVPQLNCGAMVCSQLKQHNSLNLPQY